MPAYLIFTKKSFIKVIISPNLSRLQFKLTFSGRQDECQLCSLILTIVKEIKYSPSLDDQPDNPDLKDCDMISDIKFE